MRGIYLLVTLLGLHLVSSQSLEECMALDKIPQDLSSEYEDQVDLPIDAADVLNYLELCVDDVPREPTVSQLVRRTSELCSELPIDTGSTKCSQRLVRYGYSPEKGVCTSFSYTGCGDNDNNFESLDECQNVCEDPCSQPLNVGSDTETHTSEKRPEPETVQCAKGAGQYFYYEASSRSCKGMEYKGCGGNKNRFESVEECSAVCGAVAITVDTTVNTAVLTRRQRRQTELVNDMDVPTFCSKFNETFPEMTQVVRTLDLTTAPDNEQALISEMEAQLSAQSPGTENTSRVRRALLGLLLRPLRHTSVKILNGNNCKRIEVTIRIKCLRAITHKPTTEQATHLCNLVKQGIKKHWEVNLLNADGSLNYQVLVNVKESWLLSKKVMLKWFTSSPSNTNLLRSFNLGFPWLPMWMKYSGFASNPANEDLAFMETAAHEFGHDVLKAAGGLIWSWTHEGTSTLFQNTHAGTPAVPPNPQPINLMWYFDGGDYTNYYNRVRASQTQITALINYATFRLTLPWCPGAIGSPCLNNNHCNPPGICSWFRCVLCNQDSQCSSSQYCKGIHNPFILNQCVSKKPNGALCTRDPMCLSGHCDGGQCVVCEVDSHCASNQYCKNNNIPLVPNVCENKNANGALCLQDRQCASGMCDGGQCVECEKDSDCSSSQYCKYNDVPLVLNQCVNKLGNGAWCLSDSQCSSGMCDGLRCVECEEHYHCPSNQYCKNKNIPGILNQCTNKKCTGVCTSDAMCLSGNCRFYGLCKKC